VSVIVERVTTIRSARLVNAAGGEWGNPAGEVYAAEGGAPKWLSAIALLSYLGILVGIVLVVIAGLRALL